MDGNIIKSLGKQSELKDLSIDIIEIMLDGELAEGIIKEIPIAKTVYTLSKTYKTISDRIHLKKTLLVLMELKDLTDDERHKFIEELKDKYSSGSDKLMLAISNLETYKKCSVFGRLSVLKALGKIELEDYFRLTKIIQDCYLNDLECIKNFEWETKKSEYTRDYKKLIQKGLYVEECTPLVNTGILVAWPTDPNLNKDIDSKYYKDDIEFEYSFTNVGHVFYKHLNYLLDYTD